MNFSTFNPYFNLSDILLNSDNYLAIHILAKDHYKLNFFILSPSCPQVLLIVWMERSEGLYWWVAQQCSWTASTCTPTSWWVTDERTLLSVRSQSRWAGPSCPWPPLEVCLVGSSPWSCQTALMASVSPVRPSCSHFLLLLWCRMFVKHMASCWEILGLEVLFSLIESHKGFARLICTQPLPLI